MAEDDATLSADIDKGLMEFFQSAGTGQYAVLPRPDEEKAEGEASDMPVTLEPLIEVESLDSDEEQAPQPENEPIIEALEPETGATPQADLLLPTPIQLLTSILDIAGEGRPDNYYQVRLNVGVNDSGEELREVYVLPEWEEKETGEIIAGPQAVLEQMVGSVGFARELGVRDLPISIVAFHPKKIDLKDVEGLLGHAFSISLMPEDVLQPEGYTPRSIKFDFNLRSYNSGPLVKKALQSIAPWEMALKVFSKVLSRCGRPISEDELPFSTILEKLNDLADSIPAKVVGVKYNAEAYRAYVTLQLEPHRTMIEMEDRYSGSGMFAKMRDFAELHSERTNMKYGIGSIVARFTREYIPGEIGLWED